MPDYGDPEFVMSQVQLAGVDSAAGDVTRAISLLEEVLAGDAVAVIPSAGRS